MEDLTCPFCHHKVPYGATVCQGCQAVVEYGYKSPLLLYSALVIIATIIGLFTRNSSLGGWAIFWVIVVGGIIAIKALFKALFTNHICFQHRNEFIRVR